MGTQSNSDGRFSFEAPANAMLGFSFVGYATQEIPGNGRSSLGVALGPDSWALNDVVVGYLAQDCQNLRSAVSTPNLKEATKQPVPTSTPALQEQVAGVRITGSGGPGDAPVVVIRGVSGLGFASNAPLYVIDGLWTDNSRDLNPNDTATLNVLKEASSTAIYIYGARGANGVIQITTKKGKAGVPTIGVNGSIGFDQLYKRYQLTNASQWADRAVQAYANAGLDPLNAGQNSLAGAAFNPNIDTDFIPTLATGANVVEVPNCSVTPG